MKKLHSTFGLTDGFVESIYKNCFCDPVLPEPGSVLKVDLALNPVPSACHTGIYVGDNRIVEMTNDDGTGIIKKVPPKYFLDYSLWRTGVFIYVACGRKNGKYYPLAAPEIAERALAAVGEKNDYNFLLDNCHKFTEYCITGKRDSLIGTLENIEAALVRKFFLPERRGIVSGSIVLPGLASASLPSVHWMSTGVSLNDSFPDKKRKGK